MWDWTSQTTAQKANTAGRPGQLAILGLLNLDYPQVEQSRVHGTESANDNNR
jgi:hypothetical protein